MNKKGKKKIVVPKSKKLKLISKTAQNISRNKSRNKTSNNSTTSKFVILSATFLIAFIPVIFFFASSNLNVKNTKNTSAIITPEHYMKKSDPKNQELFEKEMQVLKDNQIVEINDPLPENSGIIAQGALIKDKYSVKGTAQLIADGETLYIRIQNLETVNGPDLHILLASDLEASDYIDLGNLKGTKGNSNYKVPEHIDIDHYNKILIWSKSYGILFGYAIFPVEEE